MQTQLAEPDLSRDLDSRFWAKYDREKRQHPTAVVLYPHPRDSKCYLAFGRDARKLASALDMDSGVVNRNGETVDYFLMSIHLHERAAGVLSVRGVQVLVSSVR